MHDRHRLHPHDHGKAGDGTPKPCSGRWYCLDCKEWASRKPCVIPGAPKLPPGWLRA